MVSGRRGVLAGVAGLLMAAGCAWGQSVVVDNGNPGYSETGSGWLTGNTAAGRYGPDYRYVFASGSPGSAADATAVWRPDLPQTGYYYVYTQYPQGGNRSPDAPFTLSGDDGTSVIRVNQQINGGDFFYLGQMHFAAGTGGSVTLGNNAGNTVVIADAVRFNYVGTTPGPEPTPGGGDDGPTTSGAEIRGLWVSRFEWPQSTPDATRARIDQIMTHAQTARFNAIFFQVRGQCETFYPSPEEPWSQEVGYANLGWDPMAYAIEAAHSRGLEFHAYINTHVIYKTSQSNPQPPPANLDPPHPYYLNGNPSDPAHREWCYATQAGVQALGAGEEGYLWAAPGVPSYMEWVRRQIKYVAQNYDVDGVHFDRIRTAGTGSYDAISVARQAGAGNPGGLGFHSWTRDQITRFLNDVYGTIAEVNVARPAGKPLIKVSSAPYRGRSQQLSVNQDLDAWCAIGAQDFFCPQVYTSSLSSFQSTLDTNFPLAHGRFVVAGMSRNSSGSAAGTFQQVNVARTMGAQGSLVFSYTAFLSTDWALYPQNSHGNVVTTPDMPWLTQPADATVVGTVRDTAGQAVVDAWLTRGDVSGYTWLSGSDGYFAMLKVPAGTALSLTASKAGLGSDSLEISPLVPGEVRRVEFTLQADLVAPVISERGVRSIFQSGATVYLKTNEPTTARLRLSSSGCSGPVIAQSTGLRSEHAFPLFDLLPGTSYDFAVEASDAAGNEAAAEAGGECHSFKTSALPEGLADSFDGPAGIAGPSGAWSPGGLWRQVDPATACFSARSAPGAWYYGTTSCNYATGATTSGTLGSAAFIVPPRAVLTFASREKGEALLNFDTRKVYISPLSGAPRTLVFTSSNNTNSWYEPPPINLSAYAGQAVRVQFEFDSYDSFDNNHPGWYVDDVAVVTAPPAAAGEWSVYE